MSDELVDEGEHDGVGRGDGVETSARGERENNTRGEDEEEESSREQVHPHGSLSRR